MSRSRAHIVGVGESTYTRWGKIGDVTEHALACQAIQRAVADAGLSMDDVDGLASFAEDRNEAVFIAAELGLPALRFGNMVWMPGGGGGCAAIGNAAMAVETGQAEVVVVYRSLCQGQFFRFGNPVAAGSRRPQVVVLRNGNVLHGYVRNVSRRLVESPACVVAAVDDINPQLRRMLEARGQAIPESKPILEVNIGHPLVDRLSAEDNAEQFEDLSNIVLDHALLAEGTQLDDPAAYVRRINRFLVDSGDSHE